MNQTSNKTMYVAQVSFPDKNEAKEFSKYLIKKNYAACCQILGEIESIYSWEDKIESSKEVLLLIKFKKENCKIIEETLYKMHSYDVPEFIVTEVNFASKQYLDWVYK